VESLVFPVALDLPEVVQVRGRAWYRRPELHVTTFIPDDLAAATGIDEATLAAAAGAERPELEAVRPIRLDGRVAHVRAADGRESLVAFCDVDGLEAVFARLSARVGRELPRPPAHVTLYTAAPGMRGIALATGDDVRERAELLPEDEAAVVLRTLRA
jgi:hypothetical protein